jgi:xanthine/uracil permease
MPDSGELRAQDGIDRQWSYQQGDARSLGDLLTGLTTDLSTLLRQEVQLAKVETLEKIASAMQGIVSMAAGGFMLYAGFLTLLAALVTGIASWFSLPLWLSALIVGVVVALIGTGLLQAGRSALQQVNVVPEKTVETIKENVEMIKEKTA